MKLLPLAAVNQDGVIGDLNRQAGEAGRNVQLFNNVENFAQEQVHDRSDQQRQN